MSLLIAIPETLQGIGTMLATVTTSVVVPVAFAAWREWRRRHKAEAAADRPTIAPAALPPSNPFATPPQTDAALVALSLQTSMAQLAWNAEDLRNANRQLRRDNAEMTDETSRLSGALARERAARAKAELAVNGKDQQLHTLQQSLERVTAEREAAQRALAASMAREEAAAGELAAYKRDVQSGHTTQPSDTSITPLRPGPKPKGRP